MTKTSIVAKLAEEFDLPKSFTNDIINSLLTKVAQSLRKGESVSFLGFGRFRVRKLSTRKGTDPNTHESITIPGRNTVRFSPGIYLKSTVSRSKAVR